MNHIHQKLLPPPEAPHRRGWPWEDPPTLPSVAESLGFNLPRITIVTPSFNQAPFLEETIRSVLTQRYPNLEYIVIDGGSTDGSVAIIEKYSPWLSYWTSEKDNGQSDAINKGLARATGEIFAWLNSDDSYQPNSLWSAAEFFIHHPDVGLAYGPCNIIDAASNVIGIRRAPDENLSMMLRACSNLIPSPSSFFRTSAIRAAGGVANSLHYTMDYELCVRMLLLGCGGACWPAITANLRVHDLAKSTTGPERGILEMIGVLEAILEKADTPPDIRHDCLEGLAVASVRGAVSSARSGHLVRALIWRIKSIIRVIYALPFSKKTSRSNLLSLLLPARLCPSLRQFRLDNQLDLTTPFC